MKKITSIDKSAARQISEVTEAVLKRAAEELGLEVKVSGGKYDPTVGTFAPKVEFSLSGAKEREFELMARSFGLKPEDYGATLTTRTGTYMLEGLNPRRRKYPVEAKDVVTGQMYKLPESALDQLR